MFDVVIIGCGIIGSATAYELSKYDLNVAVLESENDVATGTTRANSAILHAGYDPLPNSLMAKLNVKGSKMAKEICKKLDVPYKQIGSLVLAFSDEDIKTIQELYNRGISNGVENIQILDDKQVKELEPNIADNVRGALYAPTAAIVNPWEFAIALAEMAVKNGVKLYLNHKVTNISTIDNGYLISTNQGEFKTKYIINAAGIYADKIHNMIAKKSFTTKPNRGEYYLLDKSEGTRVNHVIFQCPNKNGKGVLVSPTVHGNLIVGPNAIDSLDETNTTFDGLSFVKNQSRLSVPSIQFSESIRNFAGLRASTDIDDFIIGEASDAPGFFDLAGIKSPGLSSAPAIALMAVDFIKEKKKELIKKESFIDTRHKIRFKELSVEEKTNVIEKNRLYGRVICRCETITEGEIVDAIHSAIPPCSIDGIKRRVGAGMGRCQGGFCGPRVLEILSRELGLKPTEILQDKNNTYVLTNETKIVGGENV